MDKKNFLSKPLQLIILQPTSFCNLECEYCYLNLDDRNAKGIMQIEVFDALCKNIFTSKLIKQNDRINFTWHSGEPLVAPISFYKKCIELQNQYKQNILVTNQIVTNATLINEEWCNFFIQSGTSVTVSIDGPAFLHDYKRKRRNKQGSYQETKRGIDLLKSNEIPFYVLSTITDKTLDHPDELFRFLVELNPTGVGLNFEEITGYNTVSSLNKDVSEEKVEIFINELYKMNKLNRQIRIREFESILGFIFYGEEYDSFYSNSVSPFSILNVDKFGNFGTFSQELMSLQHDRFGNFILGNVIDDSIDNAYNSSKLLAIYDEIIKGVNACRDTCSYFDVCGGGMPSSKLSANGTSPNKGRFDTTETSFCKLSIQKIADVIISGLK